jgi:phage shock protein A
MGIFDRFSALLKSNINDLISKAEDPEKMLTQILVDMRGQLVKAKQQVASAIADEKRLRDQADAEFKQAQDWERRAMLAIQEGRDDLAKQALVRQAEHTSHGEQLRATWEQHRLETEKLKNQLRDLNDKIEEAKRKKNLLIARQRRAQAQQRIAETMSSLSEKSAFEAFARMEEAHREQRAHDQGVVGDRGRVHRRHAAPRVQAAREGQRERLGRQSAPRAQAEDGNAPRTRRPAEQGARRRSA